MVHINTKNEQSLYLLTSIQAFLSVHYYEERVRVWWRKFNSWWNTSVGGDIELNWLADRLAGRVG